MPGRSRWPARRASRSTLAVGNRPEFKTDIEPGETLWVPPAFVGCYRGDLDEGSYRLHRFVLEKLRPPMPKGCPDPLLVINRLRRRRDGAGDGGRGAPLRRS